MVYGPNFTVHLVFKVLVGLYEALVTAWGFTGGREVLLVAELVVACPAGRLL